MASPTTELKRTPLHSAHRDHGARLVAFGGWEMPVQYAGILPEHAAVRDRAGLFDISHMGEIVVAGPRAETALNHLLANDVRKLAVGQGQYTLLCNEQAGIIDDLIVYRIEPSVFLLVVNASRIADDFAWLNARTPVAAVFDNRSDHTAALALQGPRAAALLPVAAELKSFGIAQLTVHGVECWVARTGYTGEDGFELICDAAEALPLWRALLAQGVEPCGLGARDVLRLEMCYPLHGQDITESTTPLEAGLGRFVSWDKPEFIGRDVLLAQQTNGVSRKLVAFTMTGKTPPPRAHYPIRAAGAPTGEVTSGTQSPALQAGIGMGYVAAADATPGAALEIEIRGKTFPARVERKPLLKKSKS